MKEIRNKNRLFMIKEMEHIESQEICPKSYSEEDSWCQIQYKLNYPYRIIENMYAEPVIYEFSQTLKDDRKNWQ